MNAFSKRAFRVCHDAVDCVNLGLQLDMQDDLAKLPGVRLS